MFNTREGFDSFDLTSSLLTKVYVDCSIILRFSQTVVLISDFFCHLFFFLTPIDCYFLTILSVFLVVVFSSVTFAENLSRKPTNHMLKGHKTGVLVVHSMFCRSQ